MLRVTIAPTAALALLGTIAVLAAPRDAAAGLPEREGRVAGRVVASLLETPSLELGPVVVFLEPVGGERRFTLPRETPVVRQRNARFAPPFRVVVAGQKVEMVNDDMIYHNVFSYSRPNDFDLGMYPSGQSRTVELKYPGVVKTYCSIHESMNGTIFVSPTPWYAVAGDDGEFEIKAVPAGRYKLTAWSEKLPMQSRNIEVTQGGPLELEIDLVVTQPAAIPPSP